MRLLYHPTFRLTASRHFEIERPAACDGTKLETEQMLRLGLVSYAGPWLPPVFMLDCGLEFDMEMCREPPFQLQQL
jgi:hypothetical protein